MLKRFYVGYENYATESNTFHILALVVVALEIHL